MQTRRFTEEQQHQLRDIRRRGKNKVWPKYKKTSPQAKTSQAITSFHSYDKFHFSKCFSFLLTQVAAQNCRKRKLDQLDDLQVETCPELVPIEKLPTKFPFSWLEGDSSQNCNKSTQVGVNEQKEKLNRETEINEKLEVIYKIKLALINHLIFKYVGVYQNCR